MGKSDEYRLNHFNNLETFSGFDWCLNRENLIVTYSKKSSMARFWDLAIYGESPYQYKPDEIVKKKDSSSFKVLVDEYRSFDCKDQIYSLAWKPRNNAPSN